MILLSAFLLQAAAQGLWDRYNKDPIVRPASTPKTNPYAKYGQYELVVRFPGNGVGYNRVFQGSDKCQAAREAIDSEYVERIARMRKTTPSLIVPPAPPTAICIPL